MVEGKAPRGRPKLALEDNETREKILNTAQRLFAQKGFQKVTLRELTREAETNLAAVNYYFGSKDKLLLALIKRAAKAIYKVRMRLLDKARASKGGREKRVRRIIYSLLAPAILVSGDSDSEFLYSALIARALGDAPDDLTNLLEKQTSHLSPYVEALREALPEIELPEIYWRLHFVLNIEHAMHTELGRLQHLSNGLCDTEDREAALERILDFVVPGIIASKR